MKRNTTIEKVKELKGKVPSSPGLDGGWGWIIIIGCSLIHLFFIGYVKSFGILFHLLIQKFVDSSTTQEIDVKSLSWIPAVHIFCLNFCSAPATLLMKRYGAKRMILIGTILVCTGIFSCGLVLTTPKLLFLTHGVIADQ
ncbi:hypothetical protein SNEBB_004518 [Seison nebaliae]|nr:hypothetical protein SNEBB_004518 [Seison nebaliae]